MRPAGTVTITPHNDGLTTESPVTFTAANWWIPQTVTVTAVANPPASALHPGTRQFAVQPHLLSDIKGPLEIEGGLGSAVHPLVKAVVLPGETNAPVFPIARAAAGRSSQSTSSTCSTTRAWRTRKAR